LGERVPLNADMNSNPESLNASEIARELKASEARRQALLEFALDCIICANSQATITDFNPAAERTFRISRSEAIGKDLVQTLLPPKLRDRLRRELFTPVGGDIDVVGNRRETRCLRADGAEFPAEITVTQVTIEKQASYAVYVRDITARRMAEEELLRLASIVESSRDAIFSKDLSGCITSWNKSAELIYGYSQAEIVGRNVALLVPPERADEIAKIMEKLKAGQSVENLETIRKSRSGKLIDVSLTVSPVFDSEGKITGGSIIARDISAQKKAEEALRKANETSIYASPIAIFAADTDRRVTMWNPAAEALFGWSEQEVVGKANPSIPREEFLDAARLHMELISGQVLTGREVRRQKRDGTRVTVNLSAAPIRDANRRVKGIIGFLIDITAQRQAQEALQRAEEKYRTIVEHALEGIYQTTLDGRYISANPAMVHMLGFDSEAELMKARTDIRRQEYVNPEVRDELVKALKKQGSVQNFEYQAYRKDGKTIWVSVNARAVLTEQGTLHHFEGTVQDITQRRELEQQLRQMQKIEAIGRLAGGVAHDFNNILMAISSYAELLERKLTDDAMRRYLDEIVKATDRGSSLTQGLLTFSRKEVALPKIVELNSLIADQIKMLKRLIPENIEVKFAPGSGLDCVKADPSQLEQVIMNLVINARDAMPDGGRLTLATQNAPGDDSPALSGEVKAEQYVLLTITDNGCGMDAETKSHIFEPFFTTKDQGKGTGLGLATVFGIVKHSGGRILVTSEPGMGTTFKIFFPSVAEKVQRSAKKDGEVPVIGSGTILLVEDEDGVRNSAAEYLSESGYTVLKASGGTEALQMAEQYQQPIDLLLTDLVMPQMSGTDLAKKIAEMRPAIRTIFMSGYSNNLLSAQQITDPRHVLLKKPFRLAALGERVRQTLGKVQGAAAGE
jgi:two-component system, cell cycle sensor histidine kinase and response regulator CckA